MRCRNRNYDNNDNTSFFQLCFFSLNRNHYDNTWNSYDNTCAALYQSVKLVIFFHIRTLYSVMFSEP